MRILLSCFLLIAFSAGIQAQCECEPDNKKMNKLMAQGTDRKSDARERMEKLEAAIELDENCMEPRFILAEASFKKAKRSPNLGFGKSLGLFEEIAERCPDFHADVFQFIGMIHHNEGNWSAAKTAFEQYLSFSPLDPSKMGRDYAMRSAEIGPLLDELDANIALFDNPVPFSPVRVMGVSGSGDEYLPTLAPDNESIFYTRKYEKKAKGDLFSRPIEEFTWSKREGWESDFDAGKPLPTPFNVGDNYGGTSLSVNNREMFVTVCKQDARGYFNCDIYVSEFSKITAKDGTENYAWGALENLGPSVNSPLWEAQPSLSSDGNTLYFATLHEGTTPDVAGEPTMDIYYSKRGADGAWGKARSVGDVINTPGHEKSPFMHGDSRTLYFASQGRIGAGGYDIYYTRMQDDGSWSEPNNIGVPINTPQDEVGLIVSTDGEKAYYASNNLSGAQGYDIFSFDVPEQAKPEKVLLVRGALKDEAGQPIHDAQITLNYVESKRVERIEVSADDGSFATIINVEQEPVVMTIEKENHAFQAKLFTVENADEGIAEMDIEIKKVALAKPYTIEDIKYTTASAEIETKSKWVLDQFALYLQAHPDLQISIQGHTDNIGGAKENLTLSTERAFEVMNYLQYKGVKAGSMTFKGFGSGKPLADNSTESGRAKNRRTEFIIQSIK